MQISIQIKDTILKEQEDDDEDNYLDTARNILDLAVRLQKEKAISDDLTGLEHYLHICTDATAKDSASAGIQQAWEHGYTNGIIESVSRERV